MFYLKIQLCVLTVLCFYISNFHVAVAVPEALILTPLIKAGKIKEAQRQALVKDNEITQLAPISYSGYLTVDELNESNMFFWYFSAKVNPETAPVILWLQGGPGAPSMFGLFYENGPFEITEHRTLKARKYSWHIDHHLIFIDNPVGTGFSYTRNDAGYARNQVDVGNNLYEAMKQFFLLFPNLQSHKFYISGESYAGKYVPALGYAILTKNSNDTPKINLDGLIIGNPYTDPINQLVIGDYLHQLSLVDENIKNSFNNFMNRTISNIEEKEFEKARVLYAEMIDTDSPTDPSIYYNNTGLLSYYNYYSEFNGNALLLPKFLNITRIKNAIHVGENDFNNLTPHNIVQVHLYNDTVQSVAPWVSELLSHYRTVLYNGQLDVICSYPLMENMIRKLKFPGSNSYANALRHIWRIDSEVAGYVKQGGNLTTVLVRNAGHMVPHDQPKWAMDMLKKFIANNLVPVL